jgi:hypothetical protein
MAEKAQSLLFAIDPAKRHSVASERSILTIDSSSIPSSYEWPARYEICDPRRARGCVLIVPKLTIQIWWLDWDT